MMSRLTLLVPAAALLVLAQPAAAQLNAVFAGNTLNLCVSSASGFSDSLALNGPGAIVSSGSAGTMTFRPDGSGAFSVSSLNINHAPGSFGSRPAAEARTDCEFTYTYDASTAVIDAVMATCTGFNTTGPGAGQATQFTGQTGKFRLVDGGKAIISISSTPTVETFTNLVTGFSSERVCHRTMTRFLIGPAQ